MLTLSLSLSAKGVCLCASFFYMKLFEESGPAIAVHKGLLVPFRVPTLNMAPSRKRMAAIFGRKNKLKESFILSFDLFEFDS